MPSQTPNLGLKKPAGNETYDINTSNKNMDIIDEAISNKIVVTTNPPAISDRKKGSFYFCVTDKSPSPTPEGTIKVSPTMGIKIK